MDSEGEVKWWALWTDGGRSAEGPSCVCQSVAAGMAENPEPNNRRDSTLYLALTKAWPGARYGCTEQKAIRFTFVLSDKVYMGRATGAVLNQSLASTHMTHSVLNYQPVSFSYMAHLVLNHQPVSFSLR